MSKNMFFGNLPLPSTFRDHHSLVAGQNSSVSKISKTLGSKFTITLYNSDKGPDMRVPFREANMVRLLASSAELLKKGAKMLLSDIKLLSTTLTVLVPVASSLKWHVIGDKGETIKGISRKAGSVRCQYEESQGGFVITGRKKSEVDFAKSLILKQVGTFKEKTNTFQSSDPTEVALGNLGITFCNKSKINSIKDERKEFWETKQTLLASINPQTGEKIYPDRFVPGKVVDALIKQNQNDKSMRDHAVQHALAEKKTARQVASLAQPNTFPRTMDHIDNELSAMWAAGPSELVMDDFIPVHSHAPPPSFTHNDTKSDEPTEVEFDPDWMTDCNTEEFVPNTQGTSIYTNVDSTNLQNEINQQEMDDAYEDFLQDEEEDINADPSYDHWD
jgi:hypothetical protein